MSRRSAIRAVREAGELRRPKRVAAPRPSWPCPALIHRSYHGAAARLVEQPEDVYDPEAELDTIHCATGLGWTALIAVASIPNCTRMRWSER
ncbi:MAG: hypothetical protein MI924_30995 [Chloroflexales bacterium]|nr:hypothetical protein [Chloroflexales bacterium]